MQSVELIELAALVACHASSFVRTTKNVAEVELERYWTASKCRQDRWQIELLKLKDSRSPLLGPTGNLHRGAWSMFDEIFTGEILTRVWTGLLASFDVRRGIQQAEPVAQSVLQGHLEVRCRTLALLSAAREMSLADMVELNCLRRRCERWTDLLLAEIAPFGDVSKLAHEAERVRDFADDVRVDGSYREAAMRRSLLHTSLRAAFAKPTPLFAPNYDLNSQIAAGVVGCFPGELFDGAGVLRSAWAARLLATADDAEAMMDDYLAMTNVTIRSKPGRGGLRRF